MTKKYCLQAAKRMYATREKAEEVRQHQEQMQPASKLRVYHCEFGMHWHLTHHKRYRW
jgi:sigma54-dependent transcription regulator